MDDAASWRREEVWKARRTPRPMHVFVATILAKLMKCGSHDRFMQLRVGMAIRDVVVKNFIR